jgi:light-harvesting protein B-800-850 alpha chain
MIYGRLWCVVKPSTGIPLFLGAVALSSFMVHYMLLTHTTWLPKYYEGKAAVMATTAAPAADAAAPAAAPAPKK